MKKSLKIIVAAVLLAGVGAVVASGMSTENDAQAKPEPKISLTQAISAAERSTGGTASQAEYEQHKGQWAYNIEVLLGAKIWDVTVNSDTGAVIIATEDTQDSDDEKDGKN